MTLHVRTDYVPEHCKNYLTEGKLYEVTNLSGGLGDIVADTEEIATILLKGECAHLNAEWEQVILEEKQ